MLFVVFVYSADERVRLSVPVFACCVRFCRTAGCQVGTQFAVVVLGVIISFGVLVACTCPCTWTQLSVASDL